MISNIRMPRGIFIVPLIASLASADTVTLDGGSSQLSGTVISIQDNKLVNLATELSPKPLLLKTENVDRIDFNPRRTEPDTLTSLIGLTNGDIIPATIESFENEQLAIISPDAGSLIIPRDTVLSIQTAINQRKVLYEGPIGPDEWSPLDASRKNWTFEDRAMLANGPASAFKDMKLPRQFILRFTLVWQNNRPPNFKIYFADPATNHNDPDNRYYLQFSSAGLEIKREAATGKRYNTLMILNRSHSIYTDNRLHVELRVNRDTARIEMLLNGESEGEIADPIPMIPKGSGLALIFNHSENTTQEIRNIELLQYDDSRHRHRSENQGDLMSDSIVTRDDSRWSGTLTAIRRTDGELIYFFKSGKQEEPMKIPEQEISSVFIAGNDVAAAQATTPPYIVRLHPDGFLSLNSCNLNEESLLAEHPQIGPITLRRDRIQSIERVKSPAPVEP
jgi:hypothetical protein